MRKKINVLAPCDTSWPKGVLKGLPEVFLKAFLEAFLGAFLEAFLQEFCRGAFLEAL